MNESEDRLADLRRKARGLVQPIKTEDLVTEITREDPPIEVPREPDEILANEHLIPGARVAKQLKSDGKVPLRIETSSEFRFYIRHGRRGNPYSEESTNWYIFEYLKKVRQNEGWITIAVLMQILITNGVHRKHKNVPSFGRRFFDFIEILSHEVFQVLQVDAGTCAVRINPDGPGYSS